MKKTYLKFDKSGDEYRRLMDDITTKLESSQHSWEVDDELHILWELGDYGDTNAFLRYASALLMEGKGWYNPQEAKVVLDELIEVV